MPARVPLDVDLEDRLVYGLTPTRLAYVVISLLGGLALWSADWAPTMLRAIAALVVIGIGASMAWGRWRGTPADVWLVDLALFTARTHQVESSLRRPPILDPRI
jgi:ABC-type nickel/cobalt efflux system permease component RcnA